MSRLLIDLSNNNGSVNFKRVKEYGVWGVCLKATEGNSFIDATFATRAREAKKAGLVVLS
jgi:GH25 family lysozyme M1 (1,4-beta-N-acetylmuramidase)